MIKWVILHNPNTKMHSKIKKVKTKSAIAEEGSTVSHATNENSAHACAHAH